MGSTGRSAAAGGAAVAGDAGPVSPTRLAIASRASQRAVRFIAVLVFHVVVGRYVSMVIPLLQRCKCGPVCDCGTPRPVGAGADGQRRGAAGTAVLVVGPTFP